MAGMLPQNRGNKSANRVGSAVSRKLRSLGWNISPSARKYTHDGIFVSAQGDHVSVWISLGSVERNIAVACRMEADLSDWVKVDDVRWTQSDETDTCFIHMAYGRRK